VSIAKIFPFTEKAFSELNIRRRLTPRTSARASATGARMGGTSAAGFLAVFFEGFEAFDGFAFEEVFVFVFGFGFAFAFTVTLWGLTLFFAFTTSTLDRDYARFITRATASALEVTWSFS
jgi:hypothetical protein